MSNLSEEEKKAIQELKVLIGLEEFNKLSYKENQSINIALNLIEKQQKEIEIKEKVIDEMAEVLNDFDYDKQCESCHTDLCSASVDRTGYTKCIKEYFYREVEGK